MTEATQNQASFSQQSASRWWQWFLVYPTLAVSVLTAAPQWLDKGLAIYNNIHHSSYEEAVKENSLWHKNASCAAAPYAWYTAPTKVKVDATICDSGDVFVRVSSPGSSPKIKWLSVDDVISQTNIASLIIPSAQAKEFDKIQNNAFPPQKLSEYFKLAQYVNVSVICQRWIDQRHLLRHIVTPNGCFDEVLDTFNGGAIVNRQQVICRRSC